jgi:TPR repeat protein
MLRPFFPAVFAFAFLSTAFTQEKKPAPPMPEALQKAQEAAQAGDFAKALALLEAEAGKGNAEAANAIGELKMSGQGGKSTPAEALKWFQRGADAGFPQAHFNLARLLYRGAPDVPRDEEKAKFHMQQAAEAGFAPAQVQYGKLLEASVDLLGREPDWKEPRGWFEKAVAQGNTEGQLALMRYLDEGLGGPRDPARSMELCVQAAKAGSVVAMNEIGVRYQKGLGIRQDSVAAVGWFTLASQHGLPAAMVNLGNCYERGNGLIINYSKAGEYYATAAKANHPIAQYLLAQMFEEGRGTEVNLAYAYVNYFRAAAGGAKEAETKRDAVRKRLTQKQAREVEKLLEEKPAEPTPALKK